MNSRVPSDSGRKFALAGAFGLLQFVPGMGLALAASGMLGPAVRGALERNVIALWSGALGGGSEGFATALLGFLLLHVVSFAIPLLVSFVVLRRMRYVLTTLASVLVITSLTVVISNFVSAASMLASIEADERHRRSVAIDTLTYELADRLPVKPDPHDGDGYGRLRLLLDLDVVEPGETRVTVEFKGSQSARNIRKSKTLHLDRGKQRIEFEYVTEDFTYRRSVWVTPGNNPNVHPSFFEGWKCYSEVQVERPMPGRTPGQEVLWRTNGTHRFVLQGIQEHDAPEP